MNTFVVLMHSGVCHKFYFQHLAPISIHGKASHSKEVSVVLECSLHYFRINYSFSDPSSHEPQPEADCLHEVLEEVQSRRDETNSGTYQDLNLDTMDYTSMYSKIQDSCRQQTPTVERGGHVYAVVDSTTVDPPSQYDKLQ